MGKPLGSITADYSEHLEMPGKSQPERPKNSACCARARRSALIEVAGVAVPFPFPAFGPDFAEGWRCAVGAMREAIRDLQDRKSGKV
jgi:hypothetical protein